MFWRARTFHGGRANRFKSSRQYKRSRLAARGIETLETRRVLAVVSFAGGILTVDDTASTRNDAIAVSPTKNGLDAQVTLNGLVISNSIPLSSINKVDVLGGAGDDTITLTSIDKQVMVDGGAGSNRLAVVGHTANNAFILAGTGSDLTVNGHAYTFSNVILLNVFGQGGQDMMTVQAVPTLPVKFDGGANVDTIIGPNVDNTWNIQVVNGGNLMPTGQGTLTFGNVENLTGGTGTDAFNVSAHASMAANVDGGGGTDSLSYAGYTTPVTFQLKTKSGTGLDGYGTGIGSLLNVESITGGTANDTLLGLKAANFWNITGNNAGTVNGTGFSSFENLIGNSLVDTFQFDAGGGISGKIDGGAGSDILSLNGYSAGGSINLQSKTFSTTRTGSFANIESFVGSAAGATTLIGLNVNSTWNITGTNAGNVSGFTFSAMKNLTGGSKNDTFMFANGTAITGAIDGGAGTDVLNFSHSSSTNTVNLNFDTNLETLIGGSGADTLIGNDAGDTFNITANNAGNVTVTTTSGTTTTTTTLITFTAVENLTGGAGADLFVLSNGKGVSGKIDGGINTTGNFDELDYSAYTAPVTVDLSGQDSVSATGTATNIGGGVSHISDIFGGSGNDMLTGDSTANFIFGNGGNDTIDGGAGNNVLVGGDGNDTLKVTGSAATDGNLLLGGNGTDTLLGGLGQDILFNGTTSFDTDVATLASIETFWTGPDTFDNRVIALRAGTAAGVSVALNSTNVTDDTSVDTLTGGGERNWFFVKLTTPNTDIITDQTPGDAVN